MRRILDKICSSCQWRTSLYSVSLCYANPPVHVDGLGPVRPKVEENDYCRLWKKIQQKGGD